MQASEQEQNAANFCVKCKISFSYKHGLTAHIKKFHPEDVQIKSKVLCPVCEENKPSVFELQKHFEEKHPDIPLQFEEKTFYSEEDFVEWKSRLEEKTFSRFIKKRAPSTLADGRKVSHFYCHRSGEFKSDGEQKRHLKVKGSNKIGHSCPAHLTAYYDRMEDLLEIKVSFQSRHVGHKLEIGRIPLPNSDKNLIAGKLMMEIPKSTILKDIQRKYSPTKRVSYTHRKDLHNICRDYNINSSVRLHEDDATSIHLHIQKLKGEEGTPVVFYKPLGEICADHPSITEDDFFLMIMSGAQQKILELFGQVIMIDGTHGMNSYGYHLTTIMVNDGNYEGFPVAVLYSSRKNTETYATFFSLLKERCPSLQPGVFMSDDDPAYYNAWEMVFGPVKNNLLCSWHVLRAWNQQLNAKIRDLEQRNKVKEELNALLHETDITSFERLCENFMERVMAHDELKSFGVYFSSYYLKRKPQWAYCFRVKLGVNTNMKLERWHREIKHEEGEGKVIVRMDKSLCIVLNAISKKVIGRLISMERGKLTTKMSEIRSRHKNSKELNKESVIEITPGAEWTVFSSTAASSTMMLDTYCVLYEKECHCNIRCEDCNVCIHALSCTCHDYSIRYVICKHIHLVCSNYKIGAIRDEGNSLQEDEEMPSLAIEWSNEKALEQEEQDALDQEMKKSAAPSLSLEELKGTLNAEYSTLINSLKSEEEAKVLLENLKVLKSKLSAVNGVGITSFPEPKVKTISNKNIESQRKFKVVKATKRKHDD